MAQLRAHADEPELKDRSSRDEGPTHCGHQEKRRKGHREGVMTECNRKRRETERDRAMKEWFWAVAGAGFL